jgi:hypothetical protein
LSFTCLFKVQLWIFTFKITVTSPTFIHKLVWNSNQHIICPQILHSFQVSTFLREPIKKRQIKFCKCWVWILCVDEKKTPPILVNIWSCTFLVGVFGYEFQSQKWDTKGLGTLCWWEEKAYLTMVVSLVKWWHGWKMLCVCNPMYIKFVAS